MDVRENTTAACAGLNVDVRSPDTQRVSWTGPAVLTMCTLGVDVDSHFMTETHASGRHGADVVESVWGGVSVIGTGEGFRRQADLS